MLRCTTRTFTIFPFVFPRCFFSLLFLAIRDRFFQSALSTSLLSRALLAQYPKNPVLRTFCNFHLVIFFPAHDLADLPDRSPSRIEELLKKKCMLKFDFDVRVPKAEAGEAGLRIEDASANTRDRPKSHSSPAVPEYPIPYQDDGGGGNREVVSVTGVPGVRNTAADIISVLIDSLIFLVLAISVLFLLLLPFLRRKPANLASSSTSAMVTSTSEDIFSTTPGLTSSSQIAPRPRLFIRPRGQMSSCSLAAPIAATAAPNQRYTGSPHQGGSQVIINLSSIEEASSEGANLIDCSTPSPSCGVFGGKEFGLSSGANSEEAWQKTLSRNATNSSVKTYDLVDCTCNLK